MFKLKFPSGAVLVFKGGHSGVSTDRYEGTLYIWPEDIEPLLECLEREQNESSMSREQHARDKNSKG